MKPKWLEIINDPLENKNMDNLHTLVHSIMDQLSEDGPSITNEFLKEVQIESALPALLVAIISSSFAYRDKMPNWFILRDKMVVQFVEQGKNIQSLKGLI